MTVYKNDDVLFGKIEYRKQKIPMANFFLKDAIDVTPDDEIKIIGNYTKSSSTRTIITGTDGAPQAASDNFDSAGSTFNGGAVVVGDMLIIEDGDDIGSYIVNQIDSATRIGLNKHDGTAASFTGDTSNTFRVGKIIFKGLIDSADFEANQQIQVDSLAEELDQIRPEGTYGGYSEVIWGEMLKDASLGSITINYTESTLTIVPANITTSIGFDDDAPHGNNNAVLWDDIDEGLGSPDGYALRGGSTDWLQMNLTTHSLSANYHYYIYQADIKVRAKRAAGAGATYQAKFYDGSSWSSLGTDKSLTEDYATTTTSFSLSNLTEDDITNFKAYIECSDPTNIPYFDTIDVVIYYRYYNDFTDPGSYKQTIVVEGEKSLADYGNLFALLEQQTWYLDAGLTIYFNDGDKDSGKDFAKTDLMNNVVGTQNIKSYTRVFLKGGYVGGGQITSETGSGFPLWKDIYSNITDQTQLDNLASALLTENSANQYIIQLERSKSADGLYQVGETVTLPANPNQIKFSASSRLIPNGQYILNKVDYIINNGIYRILDIEIIDGLIFSKPPEDITTGTNAANIANEATVQVAQVGGGAGVGEANTASNIGTDGVGVYDSKSGVTLRFRNIAPASSKITVVENGDDIDIDVAATLDNIFDLGKVIDGANSEANAFGVGDGTDLLKFYTLAGEPIIKVIGDYGVIFNSDNATWVGISIQEDGANYLDLFWNKASNYSEISSSGPIRVMPSSITADYLEFYTAGGVPKIKVIGGGWYYLETDNATWVGFQMQEDGSNYLNFYWNKASNYGRIKSSGPLRLLANNDEDDYWQFVTTANVPYMTAVGAQGRITNLADPVDAQDAATRSWVNTLTIATNTLEQARNAGRDITGAVSEATGVQIGNGIDTSTFWYDTHIYMNMGSGRFRLKTDHVSWLMMDWVEDDSNYGQIAWNKTSNYFHIWSTHSIYLLTNGESDDYLEFYTSGNVPRIKTIGGNNVSIESDDASWVGLVIWEESGKELNFYYNKASDFTRIYSSHNLRLVVNADTDDYLEFSTLSNNPQIKCIGSSAFNIMTDGGVVNIKPSNDTDDYIEFKTVSNEPWITAIGGCDLNIATDNVLGELNFKVSGDNDDYISLLTASGIPYIMVKGGSNLYFKESVLGSWQTIHADAFTEHSEPLPMGNSTEKILNIKNIDGKLDHKSLPSEAYFIDKNGENEGMKLGSVVLYLVKTIQELEKRIKELEK